jgi:NADPH:quinone reductase-like Zn-dependent oxidoreductase
LPQLNWPDILEREYSQGQPFFRPDLNPKRRNTVTVTTSKQDKIDWLLKMPNGPTHAVNYKTEDFAERVNTITGGKGVNVVIDFVGQSHFNKNINALAVDGRMTMLALLSGNPTLSSLINHCGLIYAVIFQALLSRK